MLDMLTYHFRQLSNPGQPHGCGCKYRKKVRKEAIGCQLLAVSLKKESAKAACG